MWEFGQMTRTKLKEEQNDNNDVSVVGSVDSSSCGDRCFDRSRGVGVLYRRIYESAAGHCIHNFGQGQTPYSHRKSRLAYPIFLARGQTLFASHAS